MICLALTFNVVIFHQRLRNKKDVGLLKMRRRKREAGNDAQGIDSMTTGGEKKEDKNAEAR